MADEKWVAEQIAKLSTTSTEIALKSAELLKILTMIHPNDELTNWVKSGHELAEPFEVPIEYAGQFQALCKAQKIPLSELRFDGDDRPLGSPVDSGICVFTCKKSDREQAYRLAKVCERQYDKQQNYELTPDQVNEEFNGIDTNMLTNLSNVEADLLQKEMSANNIRSAKLYNAETNTYAIEISTQSIEPRTFAKEMTPLERAVASSVMKLSNSDLRKYYEDKDTAKDTASTAIEYGSKAASIDYVVYDASYPDYTMHISNQQATIMQNGQVDKTYNLYTTEGKEAALGALSRMDYPVTIKGEWYKQIAEQNPERLLEPGKRVTQAKSHELEIEGATKTLEEEGLMDMSITKSDTPIDDPDKPEKLRGHDYASKEFRIENTDRVMEIVGKIKPLSENIEADINDLDPENVKGKRNGMVEIDNKLKVDLTPDVNNNRDKLLDNAQSVLNKFGVSQTSEHMNITTRINQYAIASAEQTKTGQWAKMETSDIALDAQDMYAQDIYVDYNNVTKETDEDKRSDYTYEESNIKIPTDIADDMYINLETGEAIKYEEAMELGNEPEGPDLDDNLANDDLDEDIDAGDNFGDFSDDIGETDSGLEWE